MRLEKGVRLTGVQPELIIGLMVAEGIYRSLGFEFVITSLLDGKHSATSLHYSGNAADLRTRHMPPDIAKTARDKIAEALPDGFDVVLEKDHIHLERQARMGQ